jgi:two-component system, cell cycle sensor histidine kinase and response regulator CckA
LRVLIVEDSAGDAALMARELGRAGFAPEWRRVESFAELTAALADGAWDVMLADSAVPGLGAEDVLAISRRADPDLPFIVVSGAIGEESAIELMRAGASDFILDGRLSRLGPAIVRELDHARRRRQDRQWELAASQLAAVVQSSRDAIISMTLDGIISSWNAAAERLYGWTDSEALGHPIAIIAPPGRADEVAEMLVRVRQGEGVEPLETVRARKDGTRIDVSVTISPVQDRAGRLIGMSTIARDITDRKRAEDAADRQAEALGQSEERHRVLVETIPHMIWMTRPDGLTYYLNRRAIEHFGLLDVTGQGWDWLAIVHPDDVDHAREVWDAAVRAGDFYRSEYRVRGADGTYGWYLSQGVQLRKPDGESEGWIGTWTDTDDRKRAEQRLARDALLLAHVRDAVIVTDLEGIITDWNEGAVRLFGWTASEMLGRSLVERFPNSIRPEVTEITRAVAEGREWAGEWEDYRNDGSRVWIDARVVRIADEAGRPVAIMGVSHDITARREAEELLRLRDRAIQAVTQGILISDPGQPDTPIVYASPGFLRMTGYSAEDVVGRNARFLQGPDTDPAAVTQIREAIRDERPCTVELLNYRKDGTPLWNELSISPVSDAGGRVTHFVGIQSDVTERRRLEAQYRQAQRMEAIGQLAGGVAHDFNNLLTIIGGYSDLLLRKLDRDDGTYDMVLHIRKAGERAAALTRQLLAFSRKQILQPVVLNLSGLVAEVQKMLHRLIGEDVELVTILDPELGHIRADAGQMEQVILNLAVNARDAMSRGGTLVIETRNVELDEGYAQGHVDGKAGSYVMLAVSDTGRGMTPEVQGRIFEPFFTTKEVGRGTGLGLAMVHGLVQQSGGRIDVHSEVGRGTTFKIYLPRLHQEETAPPPEAGDPGVTRGSETVLLVEDEPGVRAFTQLVLESSGYRVLAAGHAEEALATARAHQPPLALLVTDVVMPHVSGPRLADELRSLFPGMRVLYMSGYTDEAVIRHGIVEASVAFLQKPFTPTALLHKVREVLDGPGPP